MGPPPNEMCATAEAGVKQMVGTPSEATHDGEHEEPSAEDEARKACLKADSKVEVACRKVEAVVPGEPAPDYQPDTAEVTAEAGRHEMGGNSRGRAPRVRTGGA